MDTLAIIRDKAERLEHLLPKSGILSVVRHIEFAERHFETGRREPESDLFTDAIYRTNHAFEGVLREAYAILAGQDSAGKSAFDIEKYLSQNNVFQERVMELFTNYRSKWRNPSTHDHVVTFSESEAFLAILSVTSFSGILMDQMIARLVFERQQQLFSARTDRLQEVVAQHSDESLLDRVVFLLQTFAADKNFPTINSEVELIATMRGFLSTVEPNIELSQEVPLLDGMGIMMLDLLLHQGNDAVVMELKRYRRWTPANQRAASDQIRRYMDAAPAVGGILFLFPSAEASHTGEQYNKVVVEHSDGGKRIATVRILPKQRSLPNDQA